MLMLTLLIKINVLYFYITTSQSTCAFPNVVIIIIIIIIIITTTTTTTIYHTHAGYL